MTDQPYLATTGLTPFDTNAPQAGDLARSAFPASRAGNQDMMHRICLGNSHSWHYPDPRYAPTLTVSTLDTYYKFALDGAADYLQIPWHIQIGFGERVDCVMHVAMSTVGHDLTLKSTAGSLVVPGSPTDSGDINASRQWSPAPRGMWRRDSPSWWISKVNVPIALPTIPADRLVHVGFSAKVKELGDPLYTSWTTEVKIYGMTFIDVEAL